MNIPLVDLKRQYHSLRPELERAMQSVIEDTAFIQGPYVQRFEADFARALDVSQAIGCSSGTSALFLALKALGVGSGDEVITTTHSFFATVEAIVEVGARPVLVDIDPETYTLSLQQAEQKISNKTRAVIPVHIYGNPVSMGPLMELARSAGLHIVEDCAQSHLAEYQGGKTGTFGAAGCFSFYPGKNLGAYGDAGAVTTNDKTLADRMRKLLNHGRQDKYLHDSMGYNHRMDGLQGAVLGVKLPHLEDWTRARISAAAKYNSLLKDVPGIQLPVPTADGRHVYHLYVVQVSGRDKVLADLEAAGIGAGIHYPVPLHLQPAMLEYGYRNGDFPVAEQAAARYLSLPIFPEITDSEIDYIADRLKKAVAAHG